MPRPLTASALALARVVSPADFPREEDQQSDEDYQALRAFILGRIADFEVQASTQTLPTPYKPAAPPDLELQTNAD